LLLEDLKLCVNIRSLVAHIIQSAASQSAAEKNVFADKSIVNYGGRTVKMRGDYK
jgi:hypothetical protein